MPDLLWIAHLSRTFSIVHSRGVRSMLWMKTHEIVLPDNRKKITLERQSLFGPRQRIKYIEATIQSASQESKTDVVTVTRRRIGWRFRIQYPLITTYYKKNAKGQWKPIGTSLPSWTDFFLLTMFNFLPFTRPFLTIMWSSRLICLSIPLESLPQEGTLISYCSVYLYLLFFLAKIAWCLN